MERERLRPAGFVTSGHSLAGKPQQPQPPSLLGKAPKASPQPHNFRGWALFSTDIVRECVDGESSQLRRHHLSHHRKEQTKGREAMIILVYHQQPWLRMEQGQQQSNPFSPMPHPKEEHTGALLYLYCARQRSKAISLWPHKSRLKRSEPS